MTFDQVSHPDHIGYSGRTVPEFHRSSLFTQAQTGPHVTTSPLAGNLAFVSPSVKRIDIVAGLAPKDLEVLPSNALSNRHSCEARFHAVARETAAESWWKNRFTAHF